MITITDIQKMLNGETLRNENVRKQYKLIGEIVVLVLIYIISGYHAAQQQLLLSDLQKEVRDKKFEYLTISSQLVNMTRMSHISNELQQRGSAVKENKKPAIRIE